MTEKSRSERGGRRRFNLKRREACTGWLFVSPALIGFSIFTFGSILYSLYLSFTDYNLLSKPNWLGLQNYVKAFTDDQYFYPYFGNTFYFVVALVPIVLVVSLLLAILINKKAGRLTKGYRVALFLPSITSTVAVSMVWLWIFNPDMGILNNILENHAGREKDAADEELSALLESPDAPALLRDAAREVLDSRAEWKAAEQRRRAKETEREQESTPRGGFFSGLFGGRDDDKPRKNQSPEF